MTDVGLIDIYSQLLTITLSMIPIAVFAGGLIGYVIGKIVERKHIMKEIGNLEDE